MLTFSQMQQKIFVLFGEHCSGFEMTSKKSPLWPAPTWDGRSAVLCKFQPGEELPEYLTQWVDQVDEMVAQRRSHHPRGS